MKQLGSMKAGGFVNSAVNLLVMKPTLKASESMLRQLYDDASEWFATNFQASPLILGRTELLVSWQSCRSVDAEAWCKRARTKVYIHRVSSVSGCSSSVIQCWSIVTLW